MRPAGYAGRRLFLLNEAVRIDKWLWAVRLYKTRTQASAATRAGHVKIDGQSVKPARVVRGGEIITVQVEDLTRTIKVTGLPDQRVGAKLAGQFLEDLTPASEYAKPRERRQTAPLLWPKGRGRPTKRDRRLLSQIRI
jgi:ribosome-associated heat shock protein Hsp15